MGRGSPIPPMLRRKIVEQYQKGVSQRKIAKSLKLSSSTVHNIIQRFRESGTISVCKGQGRTTILDARDLRALRRHCITYRNATVMEITTWAQEYFQKTLSVNTIHRAIRHESKFEVLFGKLGCHVIQTKEDKDNPSCYQRSVQKPASLMVWGCKSACGMGSLHIWKGTINAESRCSSNELLKDQDVRCRPSDESRSCVDNRLAAVRVTEGKGRELADVMERRKVDILCVQETRWKGSKARSIGAGFKLFYYGVDSKKNGVGVVLKEEFVRNVLEVKRVSDRVMSLKLEIEGVMLNVVSGYAPQVGCELEEKERFWSELDEVMESIPTGERVVIGADFNGHVGEGNTGDEEMMGKFGVKERNLEGQMVVDFAKRMDMGVVNTYFQKREEHRVTYKSGGRSTQKKRSEIEKKTKWWKLKKEECCEEFRQKLRQALGGQVVLPDDWETTAEVIRETGRKVLGVSSGRRKEDKETWWWNEEVQDSIQRKRLAKKKWDMDRTEENRQEYKELQRRVKREVSKAKQKAYDELYTRQRDQDGKDVQQKVDKIRKDEVRKALKRMKSGKAVGPDDIPVEVWKCLGEAAVEFLASLFNRVLENLEKAYDRVPREELWYCMRKSGVAEKYVRVVQDMYERSRTVVRCAVVMDQLSEKVRQESPWTMMFADDIVICSESREQVEENLERWRFALERRGMKVSRIQSNGECGKEKISARIKGKVYRTVVRPAMLYGLETVSLRKRQESELEVAELKMLRICLDSYKGWTGLGENSGHAAWLGRVNEEGQSRGRG
ncbi:hypothetical protein QTP86_009089 [Hemibagrus guttatus]|nr:hypothetical protein QTP86_009089 [Hemibagrus guttatus]